LERVASEPELQGFYVEVVRLSRCTPADLQRLLQLFHEGSLVVAQVAHLGYGSVLDHLPPGDVLQFGRELAAIGLPEGCCAFHILYMYCHNDAARQEACSSTLKQLLATPGMLLEQQGDSDLRGYAWQKTCEFLLEEDDPELANAVARDLVALLGARERVSYGASHYLSPVANLLLERYCDVAWPVFAQALLAEGDGWWRAHWLETSHRWGDREKSSFLTSVPVEHIILWTGEHKSGVVMRNLARLTPLYEFLEDGTANWHPLASALLDAFGDDDDFLTELRSNMASFGWEGSMVPHLEKRKAMVHQLNAHRLPEVRRWARDYATSLDREIKWREASEAEEEFLGF
jgi:hypothetical protein